MKSRSALRALVAGAMLALSGCTGGAEPPGQQDVIELKIVHEESDADVQGMYANRFEELVEARSDGRVQVETYAAGQLGTNDDYLKMVEDGAVQAAVSTPSITGSVISENDVLSIPFVFSDDMAVNHEVLRTSEALNHDLAGLYGERGVEVLSFWTEGFMAWTSNRPMNTPEGMENLRIRTMTSPMLLNTYETLGANPTPMDAGEIYTALQTNMIDATENPLFFIYSGNTHEVQDHLTVGRHHIYVTSTIINAEFLEGLPPELQEVVHTTVEELEGWSSDVQSEMNDEALNNMRQSDIQVVELTDAERARFEEMSLPVRGEVGEVLGPDAERIMSTLIEEIDRLEQAR